MSNENVISKKGIKLVLRDGKEYEVLPLTINSLVEVWPIIMKLEESKDNISKELLMEMIKIVSIALKGQVDEAKIGDLVDLVDLKTIIGAIVGLEK